MAVSVLCQWGGGLRTRHCHFYSRGAEEKWAVKFGVPVTMTTSESGMCVHTASHTTKWLSSTGSVLPHDFYPPQDVVTISSFNINTTRQSVTQHFILYTIKIVYCQGDMFRPSLDHLQAV